VPAEPGVATSEETEENTSDSTPPTSRSRRKNGAVVTHALVTVNILLWLVTVLLSDPNSPAGWIGLSPSLKGFGVLEILGAKVNSLIFAGEYWRLITAIFLHGGFIHLATNMLSLLMLGSVVERIYGSGRFFILYLFSGICGSIASYKFSPAVGVGASGAVMGLAGVIMVFTIRYRHAISPRFRDEVRRVLAPLVFLQLAIGFAWPAIDSMAHLGGFLSGCLLAALVESPLGGPFALGRERLPVSLALATGLLLLGYTGFSAAANVQRNLPSLRARGPEGLVRAVEYLRADVKRRPGDLNARLQLGDALAESRAWPEAAEQYREYLDRGGDQPEVRPKLADALLRTGRLAEAITVLEQAVRREPGNWGLKAGLALTLVQAHRAEEGVRIYEEILRQRPNDPEILNSLAYTYVDSLNSHIPEAVEMARRAVQLRPKEGMIWDTLGWAHYRNGQLQEAVAAQERAVKLLGTDPVVRYHMGVIYQAQGRREAALAEYRAALERDAKLAPAQAALRQLERAP
jgi:membrane associated rhomboid family serine protease/Flp pilus assembly protein TadD